MGLALLQYRKIFKEYVIHVLHGTKNKIKKVWKFFWGDNSF